MSRADFIIRHDNTKETESDLAKKIIVSLFARPLKFKKPVKVGIFGDSGEGKSSSYLSIAKTLLEAEGINLIDVMEEVNAYTPLQYMEKLEKLLEKKELKKVRMFGVHEARVLISSKDWQSFTTQAVANVNAMSRAIKPLAFFIISQFFGDISTDVRKTFNYVIECDRPLGQSTRIYIHKIWHDTRDLEKIKTRKRKVRGIIVTPQGRRIPFMPSYIELTLPPKEIMRLFDEQDIKAKKSLLKQTIEKTIQAMKAKFDLESSKVSGAVKFYVDNPEMLGKIGKMSRGKFKIKDEVKIMHDFTSEEVKNFGELLQVELKKNKLM